MRPPCRSGPSTVSSTPLIGPNCRTSSGSNEPRVDVRDAAGPMGAWSTILVMAAGGMRTTAHGEMDEDAVRALPPAAMMCWGLCGLPECLWLLHTATMTRLTTRTPTSPRGASGVICSTTGLSTGGGAGGRCSGGRRSAICSEGPTPRCVGSCVLFRN